jgi:putative restriction endonuclease
VTVPDQAVRVAAFAWLAEQVSTRGDVLEWKLLSDGFVFDGRRVPLVSQQGIFKPAVCELPLSIRTSPGSPYDDHFVENRLAYSYRGADTEHRENRGLRRLLEARAPLVYFHAVTEGRYLAVWPVMIVADDRANRRVFVQAEAMSSELGGVGLTGPLDEISLVTDGEARREYATRLIRQRLHQRAFHERVLDAYHSQCAMCRLKHRNLLDAAHIKPDSLGGQPVVSNGLALCKIHHAAFDLNVVGIHPEKLQVSVRADVLREIDGPMLRYGLQALQGEPVWTPRAAKLRPDPEHLRWKWGRFADAG